MSAKAAQILEGKVLAQKLQDEIKQAVASEGAPRLVALVASTDGGSQWYVGAQQKLAAKLGIDYVKVEGIKNQAELEKQILKYNRDPACHGIFLTMPLPQGFDADKALLMLDGKKDVEGITPTSLGLIVLRKAKLIPPTAYAAFKLIQFAEPSLRGKKAAIIGQSAIVGRPLQMLLGQERVTTTVCNTGTSEADMKRYASESDIVVACAGNPGLVKGDWIKTGAVVIDVGTTEVNGTLAGDVDFQSAKDRAGFITPVPGGVGPLTTTMLMHNLMTAYRLQKG